MRYLVYKYICRWYCKNMFQSVLWTHCGFWSFINFIQTNIVKQYELSWWQVMHLFENLIMCKMCNICVDHLWISSLCILIPSGYRWGHFYSREWKKIYEGHLVQSIKWNVDNNLLAPTCLIVNEIFSLQIHM